MSLFGKAICSTKEHGAPNCVVVLKRMPQGMIISCSCLYSAFHVHWLITVTVNHKNNCISHTDLEKNIIIRMYTSSWVTKLLVSALHVHLLKRNQDSKGNRKSLYFIRQKKKKSPTFKKNWKCLQLELLSTFTTVSFAEASHQQQKSNSGKYLSCLIWPHYICKKYPWCRGWL